MNKSIKKLALSLVLSSIVFNSSCNNGCFDCSVEIHPNYVLETIIYDEDMARELYKVMKSNLNEPFPLSLNETYILKTYI